MACGFAPAPPVYTYDGANPPAEAERSLNVGKEGQDVYWLQMKLKELGYYTGTCTGQYREGTRDAVKAYQKAKKLSRTGKADLNTLNTLYREVNKVTPTPRPKTTARPTKKK